MVTEILGYAASFFVVLSLLMADMKRLRYVNAVGCSLFVIYGVCIGAYPVVLMNVIALMINLYYLNKLRQEGNLNV